MPTKNSPIRKDKVKDARKFIKDFGLEDATDDQKLFFLFRERQKIDQALSFLEICLILHPHLVEKNVTNPADTGEQQEVPNDNSKGLTRQKIKNFRTNQKGQGVILYCIVEDGTNAHLYINITTLEEFKEVEKRMKKIVEGINKNKNDCIKFLKLPKSMRNRLSKNIAIQYRKDLMNKLTKKMNDRRKKELSEQIYAQ